MVHSSDKKITNPIHNISFLSGVSKEVQFTLFLTKLVQGIEENCDLAPNKFSSYQKYAIF